MNLFPCRHLDYTEGRYTDCEIRDMPSMPGVRYWERGARWANSGPGEPPNPRRVQFCGAGRGRINEIFACYGEMPCYEAEEREKEREERGDALHP